MRASVQFEADRLLILQALYAARIACPRSGALTEKALLARTGFDVERFRFHIRVLAERGWLIRPEAGLLLISSRGVEAVESAP